MHIISRKEVFHLIICSVQYVAVTTARREVAVLSN